MNLRQFIRVFAIALNLTMVVRPQIFENPYPFKVIASPPIKSSGFSYVNSYDPSIWADMNGINYRVPAMPYDFFLIGIPQDTINKRFELVLIGVRDTSGESFIKQRLLDSSISLFAGKSPKFFLERSDNSLVIFDRGPAKKIWMIKMDHSTPSPNFVTQEFPLDIGFLNRPPGFVVVSILKMGANSSLLFSAFGEAVIANTNPSGPNISIYDNYY